MSETTQSSTVAARGRGGGRSRGRGGLGKYLRARGRGRGLGRPAEFGKRLVLEGEERVDAGERDKEEEEEAAERAKKFSRRQLGSNADRYVEPEPELNSDGITSHRLISVILKSDPNRHCCRRTRTRT
jgi:hypothetical protein